MKTAAIRALRQKVAADEPAYGMWVTLESASVTEMAVRSNTVGLVRVAELNGGLILVGRDRGLRLE